MGTTLKDSISFEEPIVVFIIEYFIEISLYLLERSFEEFSSGGSLSSDDSSAEPFDESSDDSSYECLKLIILMN